MNEQFHEYYEAFYGAPIPESQIPKIHKPFHEMVSTLKSDLIAHFDHVDNAVLKSGILEALRYMNSVDTQSPLEYMRDANLAKEAFRYAVGVIKGKPVRRQRTSEEIKAVVESEKESTRSMLDEQSRQVEENAKVLQTRSQFTADLYRHYNKTKRIYLSNGEEPRDAKVKAYMALVENWEYQGGIDYYVVAMKIPMEEGIYHEIEVINTVNAHPRLSAMKRNPDAVGMRINDRPWGGLS